MLKTPNQIYQGAWFTLKKCPIKCEDTRRGGNLNLFKKIQLNLIINELQYENIEIIKVE